MSKRLGAQTVVLPSRPGILAWASTAGQKEKEGPYGEKFDSIIPDELNGQQSFEGAERAMLEETIVRCVQKANKAICDVQMLLCGDLLNQIISAGFAARNLGIPFYGLYGACSTMAESLSVGGMIADGGFADAMVCATCSHFCTAERQYRARWNWATSERRPRSGRLREQGRLCWQAENRRSMRRGLTHATCGRVIDLGISDANNMGAAMAPAGCDTLVNHFRDMNRGFDDYDLVVTGDLGHLGRDLLIELLKERKITVREDKLFDCGCHIFDARQDAHSGGSGAAVRRACFAHICFRRWRRADWSVFCSWRRVRCSARRPRCRARAFPAWRTRL